MTQELQKEIKIVETQEIEQMIAKTLQHYIDEGNQETYISAIRRDLNYLNKHTDIRNSEGVKAYIASMQRDQNNKHRLPKYANAPLSGGYKKRLTNNYNLFCIINQIPNKKAPNYNKAKSPIPIIPSTSDVEKIIACTTSKYAVIFQILSETAIEQHELHLTPRNQVNVETGEISVVGVKQHLNGIQKIKEQTRVALKWYMANYQEQYPFPSSKAQNQMWLRARKRASEKLHQPNLKEIPLKNLRNYAGAVFYLTMGKDPIQTKNFMRHKRLEQTMDYLRGLTAFSANAEYISKIATTAEEAIELLNQGFKEQAIFGDKHLYTKLKT